MVDAFARDLDARRPKDGHVRALRFAVAACLNVISAGLGERRRHRLAGRKGSGVPMATAGRDLVHAVRALAKARAFTIVCALSLGVGIGVVMALFVFMRAVFGPPAGVDPDGLVELIVRTEGELRAQQGGWDMDTWSYPDFADLRDAGPGMSLTAWTVGRSTWTEPGTSGPTRLATMYVSPNYFTTIGAGLMRGAGFDGMASDGATEPVAVVGYYLWQNRLGADPNVIGRTITLNRVEHVIAGVAPRRFQSHVSPEDGPGIDVWMPLEQHPRLSLQNADSLRFDRGADWLRVLGRLEPNTTLAQADTAVASVMSGLAARHPASNQFKSGGVEPYFPMGALARGEVRMAQAMMVGLAGLVLTIVCLNLSGMMVVRSATRERELAVRLALGASRRRLMQYLLSESLVLALIGGALASAVLFGAPVLLIWWFEIGPNADVALLKPDRWIVLYGLGACCVTTLVFGLVPAIRFSRPTLVSALKDEAGSGGGRRVGRVHRWTADGLPLDFRYRIVRVSREGEAAVQPAHTTRVGDGYFETMGIPIVRLHVGLLSTGLAARPTNFRGSLSVVRTVAGPEGPAYVWEGPAYIRQGPACVR